MGESKKEKKSKKHKRSLESDKERPDKRPAAADAGDAPMTAAGDEQRGPSGRKWTLSLAVPGTLLDQALSLEAAVCVAGQIARAAAAFQVDELVVYDDSPAATVIQPAAAVTASVTRGTALLARVLQFLDTPPHLRPNLYGSGATAAADSQSLPPELRLAAALPAADPPHHARPSATWMPYREGVVLKCEAGNGSYVDVGLDRMVWLEQELPPATRVTVHLGDVGPQTRFMAAYSETMIVGKVVSPSQPREQVGLYWGFSVRIALGLQRVFRDAVVSRSGKYDLTIGSSPAGAPTDPGSLVLPSFLHVLVVLGGGSGGAKAAAATSTAAASSGQQQQQLDLEQVVSKVPDWEHKLPQDVFNLYLNTTPHLGTLRMRTEDAVPIALSYLITPILKYGKQ